MTDRATATPLSPRNGPWGRREFLRFGLAGLGGLTLPGLLRLRAAASPSGEQPAERRVGRATPWPRFTGTWASTPAGAP